MSTLSGTHVNTFSKAHAETLGSKVASDLHQLQRFYGEPTELWINSYMTEIVTLLMGGYVESVDYGYKRNGTWALAVHYKVRTNVGLVRDDSTGQIPFGVDITGASWGSFFRYTQKYFDLVPTEKEKVQAAIPFSRGDANDPLIGISPSFNNQYSAGGVDISRGFIKQ